MTIDTSPEQPAPVRQIASAIGGWVERLGAVWVEGQITQISRRGGMTTVFMTLRDKLADVSLQVTCNRAVLDALPSPLVEGAQVVCHAKPSFYPNRGSLTLQLREIRMVGEGELLARLERRRRLLAAEGLFAPEHKRPLPFLPRAVGLVTAQRSAAERDVLEIARQRWPAVSFAVRHVAMQGVHATRDVVDALRALEADPSVEVIVVARGGGSVEDLLPFSDEALVRCVAALRTPVVSAIGHESDSPILDLVADVRASTPTDAAKRVVPDVAEELERVLTLRERTRHAVRRRLERGAAELSALRTRPVLADPRRGLDVHAHALTDLRARSARAVRARLDREQDHLGHQLARARSLSPLATMRRGYAVLSDDSGAALTSVAEARRGQSVRIRLADGLIRAQTTHVDRAALGGGPAQHEETDGQV